ncbi:TIGR00730 family Rossman fold protein [Microbacterium sp. ZXX196]|uniref:LOG family protein n=1 Tax=Microbacterium sp. ZXX196 TaxID=2609291 RepID=UPI0012B7B795|nr:TIGR00730 family Rossman fold protein [Microbacterium sp. ZXX196]MTE24218.1 TIGR00730 family Rossman fold protein [Microbacterium sp. ZXX196]
MSAITRVTVFTGSSPGASPAYRAAAEEVGSAIAAAGMGVVYGGGNVGLMGAVATAASRAGGEVIGVIPTALVDKELAHEDLTRLEVVDNMHERKMRMAHLGGAFVALPGGIGTLEEFFEAWTWLQLGIHDKPIALYDVGGFWRPLLEMVDRLVAEGFVAAHFRDALIVAETPEGLLAQLEAWERPTPKWEQPAASA